MPLIMTPAAESTEMFGQIAIATINKFLLPDLTLMLIESALKLGTATGTGTGTGDVDPSFSNCHPLRHHHHARHAQRVFLMAATV